MTRDTQKILGMIEKVDPSDTKMLDEIDARVWCFVNEINYLGAIVFEPHINAFPNNLSRTHICEKSDRFNQRNFVENHCNHVFYPSRQPYKATPNHSVIFPDRYTRSRDALKAIRPLQGCSLYRMFNSDSWDTWQCQIGWFPTTIAKYCTSPHLPTEELAELHAIIQAIEWERKNERAG